MSIKLNPKYVPIFANDTRYHVVSGGRSSGKSYAIAVYLLMLTFESKRTILFARYTMSSVAISIFPEFIDKIETLELSELFEITKSEIINKSTGSKIIFKGIKAGSGVQTANLKSIANVDTLVIEEGEEIPDEETFDKIDLSIRSNRHFNKVIVLFNPTTKASWLYDRFFGRCGVEPGSNIVQSDTTYIHTSYLDIIDQLPNSIIAALKKIKRDNPKKYEHIVLGGFLDVAEGVVFTNWRMGDFNSDIDSDFGADFGYSNDPNTLVEVAIDRKARKIWVKEHLYSTMSVANPKERMGTSELADIFRRHAGSRLIIGDSAEGRLIDEIKKTGVNIKPCVKGAGSIKEGIIILQDFEMIIDPESKNLIKELNNYVWAEKGEKPVDMYNHCFVGETLITTSEGDIRISDIQPGMLVLTSQGYKPVLKRFDNGMRPTETYLIQCGINTIKLTSTPDHKVKTNENNSIVWKKISELQSGNQVYLLNSTTEKSLDYIQTMVTSQTDQQECISMYGNSTTEKYQKDIIFTTRIITNGTILSRIWKWLQKTFIYQNILNNASKKTQNGLRYFGKQELKQLKNGTVQTTEGQHIAELLGNPGIPQHITSTPANNVGMNSNPDITRNHRSKEVILSTVISTVDREHCIKEEEKLKMVYDIMVEGCHEYFANGLLVHNCIDPLRYIVTHRLKEKLVDKFAISGVNRLNRLRISGIR